MSNESWKNERIAASPLPEFPDDLPQRRISEVVTLPEKPEGLEVRVEFLESYPHYPVRTPREGHVWKGWRGSGSLIPARRSTRPGSLWAQGILGLCRVRSRGASRP